MPHWNNQPWQRNLNKTASGKTGAVHRASSASSHTRRTLSLDQPGKPQRNAYVEGYNRTVRQELTCSAECIHSDGEAPALMADG